MAKRALITGITGQDGSYLAELLLEKGYEVFGFIRRSSVPNTERIQHIEKSITLITGDLTDLPSIISAIKTCQPDEIYNLAAQSFVATSWNQPVLTANVTGIGALNIFEAARKVKPDTRIYQAGSSEMFGEVEHSPQTEMTRFHPRSPYGVAKVFAHWSAINHRESYDMFICNGILFNHESPRRGLEFVTRKITDGVARIKAGLQDQLALGNLDAKRDWGHAKDYVKAMWLMLQQDKPGDYVIGTGEQQSVRDFCQAAFSRAGLNYEDYVVVDKKFFRPAEVHTLLADPSKARKELNWAPEISFTELVESMVDEDLKRYNTK